LLICCSVKFTHVVSPTLLHCRLVEDTAWHPVMPTEMEKWSPVQKSIYKTFLGSPLKLWASVGHWWIWHFDLNKYTEKQKPRVRLLLLLLLLLSV
jgi:omega-6 fatty acid desaturase (delta-12 desaturase)